MVVLLLKRDEKYDLYISTSTLRYTKNDRNNKNTIKKCVKMICKKSWQPQINTQERLVSEQDHSCSSVGGRWMGVGGFAVFP